MFSTFITVTLTTKFAITGASKMQHVIDPMLNGIARTLCNQHGIQNIL